MKKQIFEKYTFIIHIRYEHFISNNRLLYRYRNKCSQLLIIVLAVIAEVTY